MMCPDTDHDCDNPGCRHGGCQGRRPSLPLFRTIAEAPAKAPATIDPVIIGAVKPTEPPLQGTGRA